MEKSRAWVAGAVDSKRLLLLFALLAWLSMAAVAPARSEPDRGYLGITMQKLTDRVARGLDIKVKRGVIISEVIEGSPAEEAGLEEGDLIVEFGGERVDSPRRLRRLVRETEPGRKVEVKVVREGKTKTITVAIGEYPEGEFSFELPEDLPRLTGRIASWFRPGYLLGVRVAELNHDLASYFKVGENEGVLVLDVKKETPARRAGVKAGDVIVAVEGEKVGSPRELREALSDLEPGEEFTLKVVRHGRSKELKAKLRDRTMEGDLYSYSFRSPGGWWCWDESPARGRDLRRQVEQLREEVERLREELEEVRGD